LGPGCSLTRTLVHRSAAPVAPEGDLGGAGVPGPLLLEVLPGPPSPGRRPGGRWWASTLYGLSTGAPLSKFDSALADRGPRTRPRRGQKHRCQNLTAPLAARRPWARQAGGSLTLARGKSAAPVALRATRAAFAVQGFSFLRPFLAHPSPHPPAITGCRWMSASRSPGWPPHCQIVTVPWSAGDPEPIHAAVGVPLSKFDSPFAGRRPGPAPCLGTQKRVTVFVAPPFAPVAVGDAGDPGAPTQVFSVPIAQAHRPALVAAPANVRRHADRVAVRGATASVRQTDRANPSMAVRKSLEGARRPGLPV